MLVFLVFFTVAALVCSECLPVKPAILAMPFHQACLALAPPSHHMSEYQAALCARSPRESAAFFALEKTGLAFILSAAGLHLSIVCDFLASFIRGRMRTAACVFALLLIAALSDASPVVVRALAFLGTRRAVAHWNLGWSRAQCVVVSVLMALPFCDARGSLAGLIVSAVASLALGLDLTVQRGFLAHVWMQVRMYLLLLPTLLPFAAPSPVNVIGSFLFFPYGAVGLYLTALLGTIAGFAWPSAVHVTDMVFAAFDAVVAFLSRIPISSFEPVQVPICLLVAYLAAIAAWAWARESRA